MIALYARAAPEYELFFGLFGFSWLRGETKIMPGWPFGAANVDPTPNDPTASQRSQLSTAEEVGLVAVQLTSEEKAAARTTTTLIEQRKELERVRRKIQQKQQQEKQRWQFTQFEKARIKDVSSSPPAPFSAIVVAASKAAKPENASTASAKPWNPIDMFRSAIDQAVAAVKEAAAHTNAVHEKWQMIAKQTAENEWEEKQQAQRAAQAEAKRQARREMREHDKRVELSKSERFLKEAIQAQRRRYLAKERLEKQIYDHDLVVQKQAEERKQILVEAEERRQRMRMREEEEEKAHAAEIEAIKQERDLCTKREIDIERERVEKDQLWRDVTANRRRLRLQDELKRQSEEKKLRDAEAKARFAASEAERQTRDAQRREVERKALKEQKRASKARELAHERDRQIFKDAQVQAAKKAMELLSAEGSAAHAKLRTAEEARIALMTEQREKYAEYEQNLRDINAKEAEKRAADAREQRERDFQKLDDDAKARAAASYRIKEEQAAELQIRLQREAYDAQKKAAIADAERRKILIAKELAEQEEREAAVQARRLKTKEYNEDIKKRKMQEAMEVREKREEWRQELSDWKAIEEARELAERQAKRSEYEERKLFRERARLKSAAEKLQKQKQKLEAEKAAVEAEERMLRIAQGDLKYLSKWTKQGTDEVREVADEVRSTPAPYSSSWDLHAC